MAEVASPPGKSIAASLASGIALLSGFAGFLSALDNALAPAVYFLFAMFFFENTFAGLSSGKNLSIVKSAGLMFYTATVSVLIWGRLLYSNQVIGAAVLFLWAMASLVWVVKNCSENKDIDSIGLPIGPAAVFILSVYMLLIRFGAGSSVIFPIISLMVLFFSFMMVVKCRFSITLLKKKSYYSIVAGVLVGLIGIYMVDEVFAIMLFTVVYLFGAAVRTD